MELKLRKRINNYNRIEHFDPGTDVGKLAGLSTDPWVTKIQNNGITNYTGFNTSPLDRIKYGGSLSSTPTPTINRPKGNGANIASGVAQGIAGTALLFLANSSANSAVKSSDELLLDAGIYDAQGSGYSYMKQNDINADAANKELNLMNTRTTVGMIGTGASTGAAVGSIFGPLGGGIGAAAGALFGGLFGMFGGKSRKRKLLKRIVNAQIQTNRNNNFALASAQSDYLELQYDLNHINTQDDAVYTAKHGKDLRLPILI